MATISAKKQDMPPSGGFKPLNYSRIPAKSYFSGPALIIANLSVSAAALYVYIVYHRKRERELIEMRSSFLAITPLLVAERDREYLKQLRRNRDAEEKLMSNVEGWEVGKWKGERIFKTLPEDTLIHPDLNEYFIHTQPKFLRNYKLFKAVFAYGCSRWLDPNLIMTDFQGNEEWYKWEPDYGNASRPRLLSDGTEESLKTNDMTTNKEDFKWPKYDRGPHARKRRLLQQFLLKEVAFQNLDRMEDEQESFLMEKETTYKSQYQGDGFQAVDIAESADPEVLAKYPLYTDQAHSVYFDKIKNIKSNLVSYDPQAAFRKFSYFSKPFYAELEE